MAEVKLGRGGGAAEDRVEEVWHNENLIKTLSQHAYKERKSIFGLHYGLHLSLHYSLHHRLQPVCHNADHEPHLCHVAVGWSRLRPEAYPWLGTVRLFR